MEFVYDIDTRIDVGTGFRLNKALPVDLKTVVDTTAHRDLLLNHPTAGCIAHEGMLVFITGPDTVNPENVGKTFRLDAITRSGSTCSGTWTTVATSDKAVMDDDTIIINCALPTT